MPELYIIIARKILPIFLGARTSPYPPPPLRFPSVSYAYGPSLQFAHIKPNTHRRRDETAESRRVGVGGVYINSQLAHDDCRRIRSTIWKLAKQTVSVSVSLS